MNLLFILEWGKHGLGALWLAYAIPVTIWIVQTIKAVKSGWVQDAPTTGHSEGKEKLSIGKYHKLWYILAASIAALIIHLVIQASYK